jgi:hypothetical protein
MIETPQPAHAISAQATCDRDKLILARGIHDERRCRHGFRKTGPLACFAPTIHARRPSSIESTMFRKGGFPLFWIMF